MANPAQIRKVHAAAREVGIQEEQLRDLVEQVSGQRSVRALSFRQAGEVIDALVELGARAGDPAQRRKPSGRRKDPQEIQLITPGVRLLIQELRDELGDPWPRAAYFEGACKRVIGAMHPRTAAEAARVVEMLKRRVAARAARR